jgi:hypothetical protein
MDIFEGPAHDPEGAALQVDDVASFIYTDADVKYFYTGAYNGGDPSTITDGLPVNWTLIMMNPYKE